MYNIFDYPFDPHTLLRKKKSIKRVLIDRSDFIDKKIAVLGGSTTAEIKDMLDLFLLKDGIRPVFYESEYNKYYEDIVFGNDVLREFNPDIIFIHTTIANISRFPTIEESAKDIEALIDNELFRFAEIWDLIEEQYSCPVIQNNFEHPHYRGLGNLDAYDVHGRTHFISELNHRFSEQARQRDNLYINDINYLAAWFGLERWYDKLFWYSYKYALSYEAIPLLADSVASIIKAIYGRSKKCLVLDLDNTLWGGTIGDQGLQGIALGKENPESEAYTEFQQYVKCLKARGVILAVCSKNDYANAQEGFSHPDTILSLEDFSEFRANWEPKDKNIRDIAISLGIGIDSVVFADDNPAERALVRAQEPLVAVPELGANVARYISILDKTGYFETVSITTDDLNRNSYYVDNAHRQKSVSRFAEYDDYLRSLAMKAEIKPFAPIYLERITQLTNKTNQFNLTTKRYTFAEIEAIASDDRYVTLYGRLQDKYGDNGLVSVIAGLVSGRELHVDIWLMSCRVLKRGMEEAMLDQLVVEAMKKDVSTIIGYYYSTSKNAIVSDLFARMSFSMVECRDTNCSVWSLDISTGYKNRNSIIEVTI